MNGLVKNFLFFGSCAGVGVNSGFTADFLKSRLNESGYFLVDESELTGNIKKEVKAVQTKQKQNRLPNNPNKKNQANKETKFIPDPIIDNNIINYFSYLLLYFLMAFFSLQKKDPTATIGRYSHEIKYREFKKSKFLKKAPEKVIVREGFAKVILLIIVYKVSLAIFSSKYFKVHSVMRNIIGSFSLWSYVKKSWWGIFHIIFLFITLKNFFKIYEHCLKLKKIIFIDFLCESLIIPLDSLIYVEKNQKPKIKKPELPEVIKIFKESGLNYEVINKVINEKLKKYFDKKLEKEKFYFKMAFYNMINM